MSTMLFICVLLFICVNQAFTNDEYIIGGKEVWPPGSYPWQGILESNPLIGDYSLRCGAVYIGDVWMLTAAHCVDGTNAERLRVVLGAHDRESGALGNREFFNVSDYTVHPGWVNRGAQGFPNDIAVMQLDRAASEDNIYIRAIDVPPPGRNEVDWQDMQCRITGWGNTNNGLPNLLQQADTTVISQQECRERWSPNQVDDYHVCLMGYPDFQTGACNGDSGGPLQCREDEESEWELVGLTSWGRSGCSTFSPSVYAKVSYFSDWVDEIISGGNSTVTM